MINRRSVPFAVVVTALLLAIAACGGRDTATESRATAVPGSGGASQPQAAATARPRPANPDLIVSTTTSTVDSGLLDDLQPLFEQQTGYKLTILSQGSGAALKTAERGEADVVLAHSPDAELEFMAGGHGVRRELMMHNDFIVVGPANDPANVKASRDINDAMRRIADTGATFISRGDNSGTHALELKLWKSITLDPKGRPWYQESGTGMGQTLQIASEKAGYTISDRATYLAQQKNLQLELAREKDAALLNVYHVIQVDPKKSAKVNGEGAAAFIDFLIAPETQQRIGRFGVDKYGAPLFVPDYGKDESKLGS
jgi:tungstate transport system substrate-binding protein